MKSAPTFNSDKLAICFSRILRWSLGIVFTAAGVLNWDRGGWPAVIMGSGMFLTGFFTPRRCLHAADQGRKS